MALGRSDKEFLIRVKADIQDAVKKMQGMEQSMAAQETRAGRLTTAFKALGPVIGGLITAQSIRHIRDTTLAFDALERKLKFATGSTQGAAQEMEFLREISQRLGIDLLSAGDGYASLAAAAKDTVLEGEAAREIFTAVAEASIVMGSSADETRGALRAMEQMMNKGRVQAEELTGQLGERLTGALRIAAKGMGVTKEELLDMVQSGEVLAEDLLPKLARELRATVSADVEDAAKGAARSFQRMGTAVDELVNAIGQSGLVDLLANLAEAATKVVRAFAGLEQLQLFGDDAGDRSRALHSRLQAIYADIEKMERIAAGDGTFFERYFEYTPEQARENLKRLRAELERIRQNLRAQVFSDEEPPVEAPAPTPSPKPTPKPQKGDSGEDSGGGRTNPPRDPNEDAVRALEFEAATYGKTAKEIALYRLELRGATEDQLARAAAAIDAVDAEEQFAAALEQIEQAEQDAATAAAEENAELERQAQYWRDLVNPTNAYQRQLEEIENLYARGKISAETYQEATLSIMDGFDQVGEKVEETTDKVNQFAIQAARNIQDTLADGLFDIMNGSFDDIVSSFETMLQRMVANAIAADIGKYLFGDAGNGGELGGVAGGLLDSLFGGLFHDGGVVGAGGRAVSVPALAFAGAPRYHAGGVVGLRPDERPAVLQMGEEVLTRNDPRHRYNGGSGKTVNVTINVNDPQDAPTFQRSSGQLARQVGKMIQREMGKV